MRVIGVGSPLLRGRDISRLGLEWCFNYKSTLCRHLALAIVSQITTY
jgi:hypothetical protein